MRDERIRLIAEIGLAVALSIAINLVFTTFVPRIWPAGGSLSLNMLPIIVLALLRGPSIGVITGVLVGFTDLIFNPYVISLPQMLLDYPIAYGLVGLAGLFALRPVRPVFTTHGMQPSALKLLSFAALGAVVGGLARLAAHVVSCVIFFAQYAPEGQNVWAFSLIYNASFMIPNIIVAAIVAAIVFPLVRRFVVASQPAG